jgi:hypothetical protein
VSYSGQRPQDRLVLREGSIHPNERLIEPRPVLLWVILSVPVVGYFFWYYRAQCDCARLLDDDSNPWFWMAMLFPGMLLVVPYAVAQARVVARVEVASRMPLRASTYLALCTGGFLIPALLPLVLQGRLNQAARTNPAQLRRLRVA